MIIGPYFQLRVFARTNLTRDPKPIVLLDKFTLIGGGVDFLGIVLSAARLYSDQTGRSNFDINDSPPSDVCHPSLGIL